MKKLLLCLTILLFTTCIPYGNWNIMNEYCYTECNEIYDDIQMAQWQGNDDYLYLTRCGCLIGPEYFEKNIMVPWKNPKQTRFR